MATSPNASATVIDSPGSGGREVRSRARSSARIAAADSGRSAGVARHGPVEQVEQRVVPGVAGALGGEVDVGVLGRAAGGR